MPSVASRRPSQAFFVRTRSIVPASQASESVPNSTTRAGPTCTDIRSSCQIVIRAASLVRTSRAVSAGISAPAYWIERARMSRLRRLLSRISPAIGRPSGKTTLVGNGRIRLVMGQTITKPVFRAKAAGETTSAGLLPACSRPTVGSKSVQMRWPASGKYAASLTPLRTHARDRGPSYRHRCRARAILRRTFRETSPQL